MRFERRWAVALGTIVILIGVVSSYLKWNYFVSEVYFKQGNAAYLAIRKIEEDLSRLDSYEQQAKN
ncbi:MAG: hypothetical protein PWQ26_717, partial [Thermotoga sp.]|nr:hypothetical protein [Thermotoga sp.]